MLNRYTKARIQCPGRPCSKVAGSSPAQHHMIPHTDPTLNGGSTGVKTPKLLKGKNLVVTNKPQEFVPHLGPGFNPSELGRPSVRDDLSTNHTQEQ